MTELPDEKGGEPAETGLKDDNAREGAASGAVTMAPAADAYVVSVLTEMGGKSADYYWNNVELSVGDLCVVDEPGGMSFGKVAVARRPAALGGCCKTRPAGKVVRRATPDDMDKAELMTRKEKAAMSHCREKIIELDVPMSLSRVHYTMDGKKAIFFFTADGRVDFRELVKELANYTRVKVEMRQIGVRDEAKMMGGCGPCGQELCCATFLSDFAPVSIRMAKDQNLSLNPTKISGVCGRLMCCLAYEHAHYRELMKMAPKMGKGCNTSDGREGKVFQLNLLQERVTLIFEDESRRTLT